MPGKPSIPAGPVSPCTACEGVPAVVFQLLVPAHGARRFLSFTADIERFAGHGPTALLEDEQRFWDSIHPQDRATFIATLDEFLAAERYLETECRLCVSGPESACWVSIRMQPEHQANGDVLWYGLIADATRRKLLEHTLQQEQLRFANVVRDIPGAVFRYLLYPDGSDRVEYMSPGCDQLWEIPADAVVEDAALLWACIDDEDRPAMLESVRRSAETLETWRHKWRITTPSGRRKWVEASGQPQAREDGVVLWDTVIVDVSDRVSMERRLLHEATHDTLTGLPNRALLEERLRVAISRRQRRPQEVFAIVFLDLDRFKVVNDSLGHEAGDDLLRHVADVLRATLRGSDLACRLGGDEFVLVLEELNGLDDALHIIKRLNDRLAEPVDLAGQSVAAKASMGIVLSDDRYLEPKELLRDADIAMYRAKRDSRDFYALFDSAMHEQAVRHMRLESDLRRAVAREQFTVHYQPIVALADSKTLALEALVRWQHPDHGLMAPDQFIGLAAEAGEIRAIDRFVLRQALVDLLALRRLLGEESLRYVSVNVSARYLQEPDFVEHLEALAKETGASPESLTLEVTESELIADIGLAGRILRTLSDRGFGISLDDFGTGYSSLTYLHQLPVHSLKADRSFVASAAHDSVARGILESLSLLASSLRLPIVAEGVETREQEALVRQLGYTLAQGYRYGRPMPIDALVRHLADATPSGGSGRGADSA